MLPGGGHSWQDAGRSWCAPEPKRPTRSPRQAAVLLRWRRPAGRHQTAAPCKYSSFGIGSVWDQHLLCDPVHMPPGQRRWRSCTGIEDEQQCYKGSSKTSARHKFKTARVDAASATSTSMRSSKTPRKPQRLQVRCAFLPCAGVADACHKCTRWHDSGHASTARASVCTLPQKCPLILLHSLRG